MYRMRFLAYDGADNKLIKWPISVGQNGDDSGVASRGSSIDTEGQRISR